MGWKHRSRDQWRRLVDGWEDSGLTQAQYCRKKGISVASLQRWRHLLADTDEAGNEPALSPSFLPVRLVEHTDVASGVDLTVVLPDGVRIEVGAQCSGIMLSTVLNALRSAT